MAIHFFILIYKIVPFDKILDLKTSTLFSRRKSIIPMIFFQINTNQNIWLCCVLVIQRI